MHRCDEGRAIKSQGVLTSHGTHETRPGLVGSQPGLVDVWMVTQVTLGMKRSADVGFVDLSSLIFECNSPSSASRDKCLLFFLLITPASPRTPHIPWAPQFSFSPSNLYTEPEPSHIGLHLFPPFWLLDTYSFFRSQCRSSPQGCLPGPACSGSLFPLVIPS